MTKNGPATVAITIALALTLTACSGSGSGGGGSTQESGSSSTKAKSAADVDTCKLVTQDEVSAALGEPVQPGEHDKDNPTGCSWQAKKYPPISIVYVDLDRQFDHVYDHMKDKQVAAMFDVTKVSGIGDKAYRQESKGSTDSEPADVSDQFAVKKGSIALSFNISRQATTKGEAFAADKVLAKQAVGRL